MAMCSNYNLSCSPMSIHIILQYEHIDFVDHLEQLFLPFLMPFLESTSFAFSYQDLSIRLWERIIWRKCFSLFRLSIHQQYINQKRTLPKESSKFCCFATRENFMLLDYLQQNNDKTEITFDVRFEWCFGHPSVVWAAKTRELPIKMLSKLLGKR